MSARWKASTAHSKSTDCGLNIGDIRSVAVVNVIGGSAVSRMVCREAGRGRVAGLASFSALCGGLALPSLPSESAPDSTAMCTAPCTALPGDAASEAARAMADRCSHPSTPQ